MDFIKRRLTDIAADDNFLEVYKAVKHMYEKCEHSCSLSQFWGDLGITVSYSARGMIRQLVNGFDATPDLTKHLTLKQGFEQLRMFDIFDEDFGELSLLFSELLDELYRIYGLSLTLGEAFRVGCAHNLLGEEHFWAGEPLRMSSLRPKN